MRRVLLAPLALQDLQDIRAYIADELHSAQAAANVVERIMKAVRRLAAHPGTGAPLAALLDVDTDYRYLVCGHYTAFYRVNTDAVFVDRVLYGRRDFMKVLFGNAENAMKVAFRDLQEAFTGEAERAGIRDEADVAALVGEVRKELFEERYE